MNPILRLIATLNQAGIPFTVLLPPSRKQVLIQMNPPGQTPYRLKIKLTRTGI
jgi:hypothetical protein